MPCCPSQQFIVLLLFLLLLAVYFVNHLLLHKFVSASAYHRPLLLPLAHLLPLLLPLYHLLYEGWLGYLAGEVLDVRVHDVEKLVVEIVGF